MASLPELIGLSFPITHRRVGHFQLPKSPISSDAFQAEKVEGKTLLEAAPLAEFSDEDSWGRFLETNIRPLPSNPTNRTSDQRTGIHNYLHNHWSDEISPINLGDPAVNIFNQRFWRLHGWIDYQWWRLRLSRNLSTSDSSYQAMLHAYTGMMDMTHDHDAHGHSRKPVAMNAFKNFFALDK